MGESEYSEERVERSIRASVYGGRGCGGAFGPAEAVNKHSDSQQDQWWWQQGLVYVCRDTLLPLETQEGVH